MRAIAFAAAVLAAGPAAALSCLRPDVARSFAAAAEAEERYVVVAGELTLDAPLPGGTGAVARSVGGRIEGRALGADGRFAAPFASEVTVTSACAGPWCGSAADGEWVMFLLAGDGGYELIAEPCGRWAFEPAPEALRRIGECMTGGDCAPAP
ncbi:MAG: hypothetical protein ACU0BS_01655 [Hasllibacter sp.]